MPKLGKKLTIFSPTSVRDKLWLKHFCQQNLSLGKQTATSI